MTRAAAVPELVPGLLSVAGFDALALRHRRATGWRLAAIDSQGRMLRGRGERGCCGDEEACRIFRPQALAEAARWGEPCVLSCPRGRALWAVPLMRNQGVCGGPLVSGVASRRHARSQSPSRLSCAARSRHARQPHERCASRRAPAVRAQHGAHVRSSCA